MNRFLFVAALVMGSSCTSFHRNTAYNIWEKKPIPQRHPASLLGLGTQSFQNYEVNFAASTQKVCGLSFDRIELKSSHPDYLITARWIGHRDLPFKFPVPDSIMSIGNEDRSILLRAGKTRDIMPKNPLFPDIPILPEERQEELCPLLKNYHTNFFRVLATMKLDTESVKLNNGILEVNNAVSYLSRKTQPIDLNDYVEYAYDSLIIYDELYHSEVLDIARVHRRSGFNPKLMKLSKLPGLDARGEIPEECSGDYLRECYHFWEDHLEGVSPEAVGSMEGFFKQSEEGEKYERISYIPGLIKAFIRAEKKKVALKGVFLIGNSHLIGPFYTVDQNSQLPQSKLNSDIFYMLPDIKIGPNGKTHFEKRPPMESYTPVGRVMSISDLPNSSHSSIAASDQVKNYQLSDIIPVGRLVTKNDLERKKDPIVSNYAKKIHRWHEHLPSLEKNSLFKVSGPSMAWTFLEQDLQQFLSSFGENILSTPKEEKNRVAFLMAGHGSYLEKDMEDGTLFGMAITNRTGNQKDLGERLLQTPNGGAINTFMNSDVGYGGSDNYYNIKFMSKMKAAHNSCGSIGEALRQTVYDMLKRKTDGAGNWQLVNRQFQGSPLNLIAKQPTECGKISSLIKEKNELLGQR